MAIGVTFSISVIYTFAADTPLLLEPHNLIVDHSLPKEEADTQIIAARRYDTFWNTGDETLARASLSARSSQDKPWGSKKSKKVFGWSALWSTISATLIWRKKLCSLSTTLLAQKCNLCLRYDLSPMSPGRTPLKEWSGRKDLNLRPPGPEPGKPIT